MWVRARQCVGEAVRGCGPTPIPLSARRGPPDVSIRSSNPSGQVAAAIATAPAPASGCAHTSPRRFEAITMRTRWGSSATRSIATDLDDRAVHATTELRLLLGDAAMLEPRKRVRRNHQQTCCSRRYGISRKSRRGRMAPHAPRTAAGLRSISARLKSRGCSLYRLIVNIFGFIQIKHFPCKN